MLLPFKFNCGICLLCRVINLNFLLLLTMTFLSAWRTTAGNARLFLPKVKLSEYCLKKPLKNMKRKSEAPMKKLALLLIVVSLLVASPVMANSGNDLLGYCGDVIKLMKNKDDLSINSFNTGYCYGLLMGTLGSDELLSKYNNTKKI